MIPILYDSHEVAFTSNGLGRLADCARCVVTEERNGIYECEFDYPITGEMYSQITEGRIIAVTHDDGHDVQPFDIYARSAPLDGMVTFFAHHISYRLNNVILKPFTAASCAAALSGMATNSYNHNPFTFWTDKSVSASWSNTAPISVRAALAGQAGSILDIYGKGEYQFDKWTVRLYVNRGNDNGVSIRYGVNLTDLTQEYDESGVYTAVAPFWRSNEDDTVIMLPEGIIVSSLISTHLEPWTIESGEIVTTGDGDPIYVNIPTIKPVAMDLSEAFEEEPTVEQLRTEAQRRLDNSEAWLPDDNITVEFVDLANTEDYKAVAALQRVRLCDKVSVYCGPLGVSAVKMQVIKTVYNVLEEMYDEIELGKPKASYADTIMKQVDAAVSAATEDMATGSQLQAAIDNATSMITGATNSHVSFIYDANGGLQEIVVMDTEDINTAVNVWRWNSGGLGFSSNGYAGPYALAMTGDGAIVADMITTGSLNANLIKTGVLDGELIMAKLLQIIDADGLVVASFDDTIRLGLASKGHAEIDYNSFNLFDQGNAEYFNVGDLRDSDGVAELTFNFVGTGSANRFYMALDSSYATVTSVTVSGTATTAYTTGGTEGSTGRRTYVQFTTAPAADAPIVVNVRTTQPVYHYDIGIRKSGTEVGNYSVVEGVENTAGGAYSHAEGYGSAASGVPSHAEGASTANGDFSHAEGTSTASGEYSHAEGYECTASGKYSHAAGWKCTASGQYSHATGSNCTASGSASNASGGGCTASGMDSHAEGGVSTASGLYSHAEGFHSEANAEGSHAEGSYSNANGNYSHAEGYNSVTTGSYSHVEGFACQTTHRSQHVFGEYNVLDASSASAGARGTYIEIVGNGSGSRSNARTLDWSGNEWIAGTLTQSSDARLKAVTGDVPDVSGIRARRFRWRDDKGQHDDREHIGYFAQDVEPVAPYLVGEDASGYKSLDYIGLLCAKIESLERRISELEKERESYGDH